MAIDDRTPDQSPDDENFAALLERSLLDAVPLKPGEKVEATVLQVGGEWVFLDVGQKGEGVLDVKEVLDAEGQPAVTAGSRLTVYFLGRSADELRFTTRIGGRSGAGTAHLEEAARNGIPVEGRIEKEVKGGYEVRLPGGVRAFCPFSQLGRSRQEAGESLLGQSVPFRITQFGEQGRNIVVSRRELLEAERRQQREALRETLKEGAVVRGTVTALRDFGAFVDIGGVEGLLPVSEIAWGRVDKVEEVLQVGQVLEVAVKSCDWEKERFSFSLRDLLADPWQKVGTLYREGTTLTGTVARLAQFGAFVTLDEGIDGLLPIGKLGGGKRLRHPQEVLQVGQQLLVTIEGIDKNQRRIALGLAGEGPRDEGPTSYAAPSGAMGTLGDLLKKKLDQGKKR
ncbi:MAG: S1 RNA-binding domain-containing protein [Deltaproteobacteria bacterium]|nr:MAG: S1 RNA-binding domain-containing protein [Deltaproteobacteria bacterium]